jgi:hypothetical protein
MMCEIQSPGGRYRLGEAIHGHTGGAEGAKEEKQVKEETAEQEAELSSLGYGEHVSLDVKSEMKEVGSCVVICSVAWETTEGRRTFQRFLKYNVSQSYLMSFP